MPTLRGRVTVATLRFQPVALEELNRILMKAWYDDLGCRVDEEFGRLVFSLENEQKQSAIASVDSGLVEMTSKDADPTELLAKLAEAILTRAAIIKWGLDTELSALVRFTEGVDVVGRLTKSLESDLPILQANRLGNVDAVGVRFYLRRFNDRHHHDHHYTLDLTPSLDNPQRQLFMRLKSRRGGPFTIERFRVAISNDESFFSELIAGVPQWFLPTAQRAKSEV